MLMGQLNLDNYYIIVKKNVIEPEKCRIHHCTKKKIVGCCPCNLKVYNIRPYSLEIIGALLPFYEMIAISCMPTSELIQIVNHFENVLNKPLEEKNWRTIQLVEAMVVRGRKDKNDRIGRFKPNILKK
jgi:hypothetical protein